MFFSDTGHEDGISDADETVFFELFDVGSRAWRARFEALRPIVE